ncbi:sugar-binding transcriptional regulator [Pseudoramibacter faecis]|uniref:sugar-binding transcriptional regulator n=1 Tax=Pseudoramibacter faecis TaxID=3108534 RepID=UPI002E789385|nr:sugar-binding domain-containing protein [Pseudoramibacter sp. HA2172]
MTNRELYIKIAHLYYTMGETQDEIAKKLNMTRQKVNRMIGELQKLGVVTIRVNGFGDTNIETASLIENHFELKQVIVADTYGEKNFLPMLAARAAIYLESAIKQKMNIGVSWGITLAETIKHMSYLNRSECQVVQMVGAENNDQKSIKSDEIARALANKLDCACKILYSPVILASPQAKKLLMAEPVIQKSFASMEGCDMAVFGIGQLNKNASLSRRHLLSELELKGLNDAGYIGDICINPIKQDGEWRGCELRNRVVSADMNLLKKIPNVVAIAGGKDKMNAVIGCLNSGVIDTLIIDDETAQNIVSCLA